MQFWIQPLFIFIWLSYYWPTVHNFIIAFHSLFLHSICAFFSVLLDINWFWYYGPFKTDFKLTHNTNTLPSYPFKAGEVLLWFGLLSLTLFTHIHWRMTWANRHRACAFRLNTQRGLNGQYRDREKRQAHSHRWVCIDVIKTDGSRRRLKP